MRLPRDLSGKDLAKRLNKHGYEITRQVGSHMRFTTNVKGIHHITIPDHNSLRVGTLSAILRDVSQHLKMSKEELIDSL